MVMRLGLSFKHSLNWKRLGVCVIIIGMMKKMAEVFRYGFLIIDEHKKIPEKHNNDVCFDEC